MNSSSSRLGLASSAAAVLMFGAAFGLWNARTSRALPVVDESQRAQELLNRSFQAENSTYSARVYSVAFVGSKRVESQAQITRAPRQLAVKWLSGSARGTQTGFSERWFWRQNVGALGAYAEVAERPDEMASRRFELLKRNYIASLAPADFSHALGENVEVVELRPRNASSNSPGPARRLFVDKQSGLTVRAEAFNCQLKPVSLWQLSQIEMNPPLQTAAFQAPQTILNAAKRANWEGEELGSNKVLATQKAGIAPPEIADLPRGFELEGYGVHRCSVTKITASFTRYSDGLGTLTVFAFKPNAQTLKDAKVSCDFGAGSMMARASSTKQLVALADLPTAQLRRALDSAK